MSPEYEKADWRSINHPFSIRSSALLLCHNLLAEIRLFPFSVSSSLQHLAHSLATPWASALLSRTTHLFSCSIWASLFAHHLAIDYPKLDSLSQHWIGHLLPLSGSLSLRWITTHVLLKAKNSVKKGLFFSVVSSICPQESDASVSCRHN